jgi:dihydrofolate reductase
MRRITVVNHVSLDGVMQAPGGPDEDRRGDFDHGGWATSRMDEVMGRTLGEGMAKGGSMLFGRRTYEQFADFWPHQTDNPFTEVLDRTTKYVVSTTLTEPLGWQHSTLLAGDAVTSVARLKAEGDDDLTVLGSGALLRSLAGHGLIDEYLLMIHPLVLGSGQRLFAEDGPTVDLRLVGSTVTTTGVIMATYHPA